MNRIYTFFEGPTGRPWLKIQEEGKVESTHHQLSLGSYRRFVRVLRAERKKLPPVILDRLNWASGESVFGKDWGIAWQVKVPSSISRRRTWRIEIDRVQNGRGVYPQRVVVGMTRLEAENQLLKLRAEYHAQDYVGSGLSLFKNVEGVEHLVYLFMEEGRRELWQATPQQSGSNEAPGSIEW